MTGEFRRVWLRPLLLASVVIVLDQIAKSLIWNSLGPVPGTSMPLVGDWLRFTFVQNTGIAFGLFQNIPYFFTITSILITIGALYFYRYHLPNRHWLVQTCIGIILGGAIGNIIDRARLGFVIDYVHITWFPGIFNIADSAITIGVVVLAVFLVFKGDDGDADQVRSAPPADDPLLGDLLGRDSWPRQGDR